MHSRIQWFSRQSVSFQCTDNTLQTRKQFMFRLELYCPTLVLDSGEQWLTRDQDKGVCSNCTEIQQLTEGLRTPLFSTSLLYCMLKVGKQEKRTEKNKLLTDMQDQKFLRLGQHVHSQCILTRRRNRVKEHRSRSCLTACLSSSLDQDTTWHHRAGQPVTWDDAGAFYVNILAWHG